VCCALFRFAFAVNPATTCSLSTFNFAVDLSKLLPAPLYSTHNMQEPCYKTKITGASRACHAWMAGTRVESSTCNACTAASITSSCCPIATTRADTEGLGADPYISSSGMLPAHVLPASAVLLPPLPASRAVQSAHCY
jgi:hypothetical protein